MIRYKHIRLIDALCISTLIVASASSCSEREEIDVYPSLSDAEITFSLSEWAPIAASRASLFENEGDLLDTEKGGGNFTLYAYLDSDNKVYMDGVRASYFNDPFDPAGSKWLLLDGNGDPRTYYWPNSEKLNFFAYMPNSDYDVPYEGYEKKKTHVEVSDGYSREKGKQFSCKLPSSSKDEYKTQEFIYAFVTKRTMQKDTVQLKFYHPFALINFKLKSGSYRMTVNEFKFSNIHLEGTFSTAEAKWDSTDKEKEEYTAKINKRVPNEINYNTNLSDWFVVMPQDLNGVVLTLDATRDPDKTNATETGITKQFSLVDGDKWEPGHKYTYIISYGNNQEEIYFNVEVEKWDVGYEHNIDVE